MHQCVRDWFDLEVKLTRYKNGRLWNYRLCCIFKEKGFCVPGKACLKWRVSRNSGMFRKNGKTSLILDMKIASPCAYFIPFVRKFCSRFRVRIFHLDSFNTWQSIKEAIKIKSTAFNWDEFLHSSPIIYIENYWTIEIDYSYHTIVTAITDNTHSSPTETYKNKLSFYLSFLYFFCHCVQYALDLTEVNPVGKNATRNQQKREPFT